MKRIRFLLIPLLVLLFVSCQPSLVETAIRQQLQDYPESRVQDIYKSFCQDNLGPGHLVPNPESAREYLREELLSYREDLDSLRYPAPQRRYYPVGDKGDYVRVDLSVVLDSLISEEALLDAFVRSANEGRTVSPQQWVAKWNEVAKVIRRDFGLIPDAEKDLDRIDAAIRDGQLIMHHSAEFGSAYHPHYRIVARDIFETQLRAHLD